MYYLYKSNSNSGHWKHGETNMLYGIILSEKAGGGGVTKRSVKL